MAIRKRAPSLDRMPVEAPSLCLSPSKLALASLHPGVAASASASGCGSKRCKHANERVKKSNAAFAADEQPSFPRKRESIYPYGTSGYMDPRMRGDDGLALNLVCHSLLADFFTRSKACLRGEGQDEGGLFPDRISSTSRASLELAMTKSGRDLPLQLHRYDLTAAANPAQRCDLLHKRLIQEAKNALQAADGE